MVAVLSLLVSLPPFVAPAIVQGVLGIEVAAGRGNRDGLSLHDFGRLHRAGCGRRHSGKPKLKIRPVRRRTPSSETRRRSGKAEDTTCEKL